jgi:hypothetical protein
MKTLFYLFVALASFLLVLPAAAMAVEYHVANQITLTWDVTPPNNAGEKIEYAIYIAPSGDKSTPVKLWQGPLLEYTVTLTDEGLFIFGLETIRLIDNDGTFEEVSKAAIGWSDDPAVAPAPFGVRHYLPPGMGSGFAVK